MTDAGAFLSWQGHAAKYGTHGCDPQVAAFLLVTWELSRPLAFPGSDQ